MPKKGNVPTQKTGATSKSKGQKAKKKIAKKQTVSSSARAKYKRECKKEPVVISAVLDCEIKKLVSPRKDRVKLEKHLKDIKAHKEKYKNRLKNEPDVVAHKGKITEAEGEEAATKLMIMNYAKGKGDYQLLWGFSAGTGVDQVWYSKTTDSYMVVEAKGPGAKLSTGAIKGDQMTKEWVRNSLIAVGDAHAKRMLGAMDSGPPPNVFGRVIEADLVGGAREVACPDNGTYHAT